MPVINILIIVCVVYVCFLFFVAFWAERQAHKGKLSWLRSPLVYTLSLSIYCTAWTFYGAVGYAARSGLEFLTVYMGPTLVMIGWWWVLRKLVRIGRAQRLTSIADLISSRFGKSNTLAVAVTLIAVLGTTPYIALQLQSVTLSFAAFSEVVLFETPSSPSPTSALWVAVGLAGFTILFGTRKLDVNERHDGVVMAIAVEAIVKLLTLLAVGIFVVWGLSDGVQDMLSRIDKSSIGQWEFDSGRWVSITFLSAAAFLTLPRMFQVLVVENADESHLNTASWAFPAYLLLMSLFVVPIAVMGLDYLPATANPDLFVLTLPLSQGWDRLAIAAFIGGFSSATSMVIVASLAIATMVSNHIVMPIWLRIRGETASISGDVREVILISRRVSIGAIVFLGYLYFSISGGGAALAAIGLVSFAGIVQVLPALIGGLFWRAATRIGALGGLCTGFLIWVYTLFLPSFGPDVFISQHFMDHGPYGLSWLRPQALFGIMTMDPIVHAVFWSMLLNSGVFIFLSLITFPSALERLQGAQFVNVLKNNTNPKSWNVGTAQSEDLMIMTQRILGSREARAFFNKEAERQGIQGTAFPKPTPEFLERLERELAGSVGAATAHAMVGQIVGGSSVSVHDLMAMADETAQIIIYSDRLEAQSRELEQTASQLREANDKLTALSVQKDAFLTQISHELRTPMTSIRAFSEILRDANGVSAVEQIKFSTIIQDESIRLTRLLDDLLDLSVLESGQVELNVQKGDLREIIDAAISPAIAGGDGVHLTVTVNHPLEDISITTDLDRLGQVFINLINNAQKYCDAETPELVITVGAGLEVLKVDFVDNGSGIEQEMQAVVFEKFARVSPQRAGGGAGLGLSICKQIMMRLGGDIKLLPSSGGAHFQIILPYRPRYNPR